MAFRSYRREVEDEIDDFLRRKNAAAAISIQNETKKLSPVDTGRLRASIDNDSDVTGLVVGTDVKYAWFVEGGTRHMRPQPYLRTGLLKSIPSLKRIYAEGD